jgi:hypothetical protein
MYSMYSVIQFTVQYLVYPFETATLPVNASASTSESTTCSWLHCLLLEHVENTEKNMGKKMAALFSDLYIVVSSPVPWWSD